MFESSLRLRIRNVSFFSSWKNAMPIFFRLAFVLSFVGINVSIAARENKAKKAKLNFASTFLLIIHLSYSSIRND